jgi:ankyrin repeat protein
MKLDATRSFEIFEALLKAGADVSVVSRDGKSALHLAIVSGKGRSFEMFETLLESKADVNVIKGDCASALHLVIASGTGRSFDMFDAMFETNADVTHDVINGDTRPTARTLTESHTSRRRQPSEMHLGMSGGKT